MSSQFSRFIDPIDPKVALTRFRRVKLMALPSPFFFPQKISKYSQFFILDEKIGKKEAEKGEQIKPLFTEGGGGPHRHDTWAFNFNNASKLIGYRWRGGVPMTARTQFPRTQHAPLAVSRRSAACMYDNYVALQALMVAKFPRSTVDRRLAMAKLLLDPTDHPHCTHSSFDAFITRFVYIHKLWTR